MERGTIVEYIDQQKIFCAVILEQNDQRVRLLNEDNHEDNQKLGRLSHTSKIRLKMNQGREKLIASLKETARLRKSLSEQINIQELWEVLSPMGEWVDLETMAGLCFPENPTGDHEAAVIRACFENRIYFKFNRDSFYPYSDEQVEKNIASEKEKERRNFLINAGGKWLRSVIDGSVDQTPEDTSLFVEILKSYYLFGKESPHCSVGRAMLLKSGVENVEKIFDVMVKIGEWTPDQNIDLKRLGVPVFFPKSVLKDADAIPDALDLKSFEPRRKNLITLPLITIDGQGTLDFDDALSIEAEGSYYRVGVHIADVCAYVKKGDTIDQEIINRIKKKTFSGNVNLYAGYENFNDSSQVG